MFDKLKSKAAEIKNSAVRNVQASKDKFEMSAQEALADAKDAAKGMKNAVRNRLDSSRYDNVM